MHETVSTDLSYVWNAFHILHGAAQNLPSFCAVVKGKGEGRGPELQQPLHKPGQQRVGPRVDGTLTLPAESVRSRVTPGAASQGQSLEELVIGLVGDE